MKQNQETYLNLVAEIAAKTATETAIESLKYGFDQLNLNEICAGAHIENAASNKILQKVGLKKIGRCYW